MGLRRNIATLAAASLGIPFVAFAQGDLPLPELGPNGEPGLPELRKPSTGGTLHQKPSGVTSPPTAGTKQPRRPGGPARARWRFLPNTPGLSKKARAEVNTPSERAPSPAIRGILLIPGVPTTDVKNGSTREFARALPVPRGFRGMRDLGTGTPKDVINQFKKFLGRPGNDETMELLTEMAVFAFGASGYAIKAVHIHDTPEEDGIVRMVIVPPTTFATR